MNHEIIRILTPKEYISAFLEKDLRTDQRNLREKRKFIYKYNVLDMITPSASGVIGKNKILLVLKYKENTRKSPNNFNFIIDFSGDSPHITEEILKAYLNKITKNNITCNDNFEYSVHVKILNSDGNLIDCIGNSLFNLILDVSNDKNIPDPLNFCFINKFSSETFCIIDKKVLIDPTNEEIELSSVFATIIKYSDGKFFLFKIHGHALNKQYLNILY